MFRSILKDMKNKYNIENMILDIIIENFNDKYSFLNKDSKMDKKAIKEIKKMMKSDLEYFEELL